jgi:hypothetical protein
MAVARFQLTIIIMGSVNRSRIGRIMVTSRNALRSGMWSGLRVRYSPVGDALRNAATWRSSKRLGRLSFNPKQRRNMMPVAIAAM